MKEVIGVGEIAKMLAVTPETVRQWSVSGKLPTFRFDSNGRWKAYRQDIIDWIESKRNVPKVTETASPSEQSS